MCIPMTEQGAQPESLSVLFLSACNTAVLLAVAVKAVCGTRRGIIATSLRPSRIHFELTSGPERLKEKPRL